MSKKPLINLRLKFELGILGICIVSALIFVICYYCLPTHREGIRFVGTALTGAVAIYTAYHVAQTFDNNLSRKKQESAYQFLDLLNTADWVAVRDVLDSIGDAKADHRAQYATVTADPATRQKVIQALGMFEDIAIAISTGYADEDVLFRSISGMVPRYFNGFYGYICELRRVEGCDTFYKELEQLNNSWKNRSQ